MSGLRDYTPLSRLGAGATGTVDLARHEPTGTLVAIKLLSDELRADPNFLDRFRAEAAVLRGLRHPNVVALYDYVEEPGTAAIVLELVEGAPLRSIIDAAGTAGPEAALLVMRGSLRGLQAAHAAGIVHRDYKPENVLVDRQGESRLIDFGIAQRHGEGGWRAGTPAYMAPEQWRAGAATPQTDVYAVTAVLIECLTGRPPYGDGEQAALRLAHENAPIPDGAVHPELRGLVRRGLAKRPEERYATAQELTSELEVAAERACGPGWDQRGANALAGSVLTALQSLPGLLAGRAGSTAAAAVVDQAGAAPTGAVQAANVQPGVLPPSAAVQPPGAVPGTTGLPGAAPAAGATGGSVGVPEMGSAPPGGFDASATRPGMHAPGSGPDRLDASAPPPGTHTPGSPSGRLDPSVTQPAIPTGRKPPGAPDTSAGQPGIPGVPATSPAALDASAAQRAMPAVAGASASAPGTSPAMPAAEPGAPATAGTAGGSAPPRGGVAGAAWVARPLVAGDRARLLGLARPPIPRGWKPPVPAPLQRRPRGRPNLARPLAALAAVGALGGAGIAVGQPASGPGSVARSTAIVRASPSPCPSQDAGLPGVPGVAQMAARLPVAGVPAAGKLCPMPTPPKVASQLSNQELAGAVNCDCQHVDFGLLTGPFQKDCRNGEQALRKKAALSGLSLTVVDHKITGGDLCGSNSGPNAWPAAGMPDYPPPPDTSPGCVFVGGLVQYSCPPKPTAMRGPPGGARSRGSPPSGGDGPAEA